MTASRQHSLNTRSIAGVLIWCIFRLDGFTYITNCYEICFLISKCLVHSSEREKNRGGAVGVGGGNYDVNTKSRMCFSCDVFD